MQYPMDEPFRVYPRPESRSEWSVDDFVVEAEFANPVDEGGGIWDYGFLFGPEGNLDDYRLLVGSDGRWTLELGSTTMQSGQLERLNLAARESNTLRLVVTEGTGLFYVNEEFVATLDVPAAKDGGKLWLVSSVEGRPIQCRRFDVWLL